MLAARRLGAMAASEAAATREPAGGPPGPATPGTEWLILQRLDDLGRAQDEQRTEAREQVGLRADVKEQIAHLDT